MRRKSFGVLQPCLHRQNHHLHGDLGALSETPEGLHHICRVVALDLARKDHVPRFLKALDLFFREPVPADAYRGQAQVGAHL